MCTPMAREMEKFQPHRMTRYNYCYPKNMVQEVCGGIR